MMGKLPIWMDGSNAQAFKEIMSNWWEQVGLWARLPNTTFDVLECDLEFVNLIAFQRGIDRYAGEDEGFYRLRVYHALRNARAAGTPSGTQQILSNLRLPTASFDERVSKYEWDTTKVTFSGREFVPLADEIRFALDFYWRTCRRYHIALNTEAQTQYGPANTFTRRGRAQSSITPATIQPRSQHNSIPLANTLTRRAQRSSTSTPVGIQPRGVSSVIGASNTLTRRVQNSNISTPVGIQPRRVSSVIGVSNTLTRRLQHKIKTKPVGIRARVSQLNIPALSNVLSVRYKHSRSFTV